jgi:3-hydroxyisobutyrate dehydrogenase
MSESGPRVAILGVGTMGTGMAHSLIREGFTPALWDRNPTRLAAFQAPDARACDTASDAVRDADVVITMVTDADAVVEIADGEGMLESLGSGAVWAQMSTIGVAGTERAAALVADRRPDVLFVDAPVTGSRDVAETGSLTILASGPESARARVTPVFDALGQRTLWFGPAGQGTAMKLANNTMLAFIAHGLGEALSVAHHLNLTTEAVSDTFNAGTFASPYLSHKLSRIEHDDYAAEFALGLALKDVKLALDTVDPARHPVLDSLASQWQEASDDGLATQDLTAIARVLVEPT